MTTVSPSSAAISDTLPPARTDGVAWEPHWEDPADAGFTWHYDLTHFPDPLTPLGYDLYIGPFLDGFGMGRPDEPRSFASTRVNGYVFMCNRQAPKTGGEAPEPTLEERLVKLEAARAGERWRGEILPELLTTIEHYRSTDFDALDDAALVGEIERLRERRVRAGVLHMLALRPWSQAMTLLVDAYKELTGGDGVQAARLVQGYGNKSVETDHALWRLSRQAAALPAVRKRLARVDARTAGATLAALEADAAAAPFVSALGAFLEEYGWRSDLFELAMPSWAEDPTIPLCQLRAFLVMEDRDPEVELARLAAERDALVAATLAGLEPEKRALLERVLAAVRDVVSLQEDHNFYIDQRLALLPRRLVLAAARRLVSRGLLAAEGDVFFLHAAELCGALGSTLEDGSQPAGGLAALVDERRAELARWATLTPPAYLGAAPPPPEPAAAGGGAANGTIEDDGAVVLTGNGGSAGIARGPARILRTLSEADRLRPGDVLVARTTMPPWTPLFAVASALVVEVGGVLSHPAVTAREYGLPAVLNVRGATTKIRDGQLLEVDGTRGRVRLLS